MGVEVVVTSDSHDGAMASANVRKAAQHAGADLIEAPPHLSVLNMPFPSICHPCHHST